ncbi:hypothetical protein BH11ARM2_BH11ARM2_22030 [soil metagenome]
MNLILLALARSTAPLLLAFGAAFLRLPTVVRRRAVRLGLFFALLAAGSAFYAPQGPARYVRAPFPSVAIVQPDSVEPVAAKGAEVASPTPTSAPLRRERLYGLVALGAALPLLLGAIRLRGIVRESEEISEASLPSIARQLGIAPPRLRASRRIATPFVTGVLRPTIVMPQCVAGSEASRAVLGHEAAHVRNHDVAWRLFHRLLCVLLWPQPLVWLLLRPAAAIEEEACDLDALQTGIAASDYARTLLSVVAGEVPAPAIGMRTSGSSLSRRIAALLGYVPMKPRTLLLLSSSLVPVAVAGFVAAFCLASATQAETGGPPLPLGLQKLRVTGPGGKPVKLTSATLLVNDGGREAKTRDLAFLGDTITYKLDDLRGKEGSARILVVSEGGAIGFRRVWPIVPPAQTLELLPAAKRTVTVMLPDGKPAPGLTIIPTILNRHTKVPGDAIHDAEWVVLPPKLGARLAVKTDSHGRAVFREIPLDTEVGLDTSDGRYAAIQDRFKAGNPSLAIVLAPAAMIEGRVTRYGHPVSGVGVAAQENTDISGPLGGYAWAETLTDQDGCYRLARLPKSAVNVALFSDTIPGRDASARAHEGIRVRPGSRVTGIDFALTPGATIQGTVFGPDGKPKSGGMVGVYGPAHPNSSAWVDGLTADKSGHYSLHVPPGAQKVYIMDSRFEQDMRTVNVADGQVLNIDFRLIPAAQDPAMP